MNLYECVQWYLFCKCVSNRQRYPGCKYSHFSRVICACFFFHPKVFDLVLLIHKSVSVSFPLPFPGRLWFIDRKCIHIKMLLLTNLLCCKLISFMSFCLYACIYVILSWLFFFPFIFSIGSVWIGFVLPSFGLHKLCHVYCFSVGFITPFVSYAAVFKWFVISCWYLLFKFSRFCMNIFVIGAYIVVGGGIGAFFYVIEHFHPNWNSMCFETKKMDSIEKRAHRIYGIPINIHHHDFDPFFFLSIILSSYHGAMFVFQSLLYETHRSLKYEHWNSVEESVRKMWAYNIWPSL